MPVSEGPVSEGTAAVPLDREGRRTHPLTGVLQGLVWAGAACAGLATSVLSGDTFGDLPWWVGLLVVVLGALALGELIGLVQWWFTRYLVDADELRIDSGVLTKSSRRIPFERIQSVDIAEPLVARVFGLAELRVDLAGGEDSSTRLRLLPLDQARAMRRLLLDRAHGRRDDGPDAPDLDPADEGELITVVPPERIILGTVLSLDFLGAVGVLVLLLAAAVGFSQPLVLLGGVVPVVTWAVRIIAVRVVSQWGFTLRRTPRGLRIERGLLSRTSQTIPFARVQGVAVDEPVVWRRLGWQRLEVDVAGYASASDDSITETSSTLLPIADAALAAAVVDELVHHGVDVPHVRVARRGWPFAPVGWRFRWIGAEGPVVVSRTGWLSRRTSVVPHHKAQSVALRQGPLQRRLRVATVEVHTPAGPVDVEARHLTSADARAVWEDQLARAREARQR